MSPRSITAIYLSGCVVSSTIGGTVAARLSCYDRPEEYSLEQIQAARRIADVLEVMNARLERIEDAIQAAPR